MSDWQPSSTLTTLKQRAHIIRLIREFFEKRDVLEVDTPLLSLYGATDVFIDGITAKALGQTHYLQTSPEYAMKRLLASGSGDIFQLCKAFRNDESGKLHRPEFTLLEWYRVNWSYHQLMDEVDALLQRILECPKAKRISYEALFQEHLNINPHMVTLETLQSIAKEHQLLDTLGEQHENKDDWLMLLLSHLIESTLGIDTPCFIYAYPPTQAALAKISNGTALRFEVYVNGIELANGFEELQDAKEQLKRFESDNQKREQLGKPTIPIDTHFISALEHGLPNCSGVALGVDRLVMLALNKGSIEDVMV
jgi:lysyl-tRNA synthetase class 2